MDEEAEKTWIQDRIRLAATRSKEIFASWPVICLTILILIFITLPEFLTLAIGRETIIPILSEISLEGRFAILFSFSVALFTSMQYILEKKRNRINDLRNELEKAYGPLYSLFNPYYLDAYGYDTTEGPVNIINININKSEKEKLNFILSNYPFMFKPEIFNYWREYLQYQAIPDDSDERMFSIDYEFIQMIQGEYHIRIEKYNNLLGKKSARS